MSTRISSYAVGFSKHDSSLAVVPISTESEEVGEPLFLPAGSIQSIRTSTQGEKVIKSDLWEGALRFVVPYFTLENAQDLFQLPIVQMEAATEFDQWIKEKF